VTNVLLAVGLGLILMVVAWLAKRWLRSG
jgi:hypothetical protein